MAVTPFVMFNRSQPPGSCSAAWAGTCISRAEAAVRERSVARRAQFELIIISIVTLVRPFGARSSQVQAPRMTQELIPKKLIEASSLGGGVTAPGKATR